MKLLVIGDFHGAFPKKMRKLILKEKIDVLVSNGDYFPFFYRKLWFKHCFDTEVLLWEVTGKKKYQALVEKDLRAGENVLQQLHQLSVPVVTVVGNLDHENKNDVRDLKKPRGKRYWAWEWRDFFTPLVNKYPNIHRVDYRFYRVGAYVFIGMNGHSFPGRVKSKAYRQSRRRLDALFRRFAIENRERRVIFVSHNVPYWTTLDTIGKRAHAIVRGKHYGSKLARRILDRYQPVLAVGGHIHEGRGMQKLGRTACVNPGAAHEGHATIVELVGGKVKNVKFVREI